MGELSNGHTAKRAAAPIAIELHESFDQENFPSRGTLFPALVTMDPTRMHVTHKRKGGTIDTEGLIAGLTLTDCGTPSSTAQRTAGNERDFPASPYRAGGVRLGSRT